MRLPRLRLPVLTKTEKSALLVLILVISGGSALRTWERSGVVIGPVKDWETLRRLVLQARQNAGGDTVFPCFTTPPMITGEYWPQRKQDSSEEKQNQLGRSGSKKTPPISPIDLNTAGVEILQKLPGIGTGTAKAIVAYQVSHGKFRKVEDLLEVKGIGPKKFATLRPFVRVLMS